MEKRSRSVVKTFPVKLSKEMNYEEVYERSMKKWEDYDRTFSRDRGYILVYSDDKIARTIPGSSEEFMLQKYKEGLGKSYARIIMYLCPATEIKGRERFLRKNDHQHSILWFAGEEPYLCAFTPANSSAPLLRK